MQVRMSRDELKAEAKKLDLLEHYERVQKATQQYALGYLTVNMSGNDGKYEQMWCLEPDNHKDISPLAAIARKNYNTMIAEQIAYIKSTLGIELQ